MHWVVNEKRLILLANFTIQHQIQKISDEWLKFNLYIQQPIETKLQCVFKKSTLMQNVSFSLFSLIFYLL